MTASKTIITRKAIREMEAYRPPTEGRKGKLRLDFNENTTGCSPKVMMALRKISPECVSVYPEYGDFLEELAFYLNVKPSEVLLTNGSDEAIELVMKTYLEKGDEVIIPVPTFAMFRFYASLMGAKSREIPYNRDLSFPLRRVIKSISKKTKMVVLVNPNNPTGTTIPKKGVAEIAKKAKNAVVLIDEAYCQFYKKSSKGLVNAYNNVIITQTFSKAFGLAGLRLGCILSNADMIRQMQKIKSPYNVNALAVVAGSAALKDLAYVQGYANEVGKAKKLLIACLKKLNIKFYRSDANFMLAYFGEQARYVEEKLREKGILVRNRSSDLLLNGCIRISIGTRKQMRVFIKNLKEILEDLK